MEICDLNDKEFKIAVLKELTKIQENSGSFMNSEIKSMKEMKILPKRLKLKNTHTKTKILETKNSINKKMNEIANLGNSGPDGGKN